MHFGINIVIGWDTLLLSPLLHTDTEIVLKYTL